MVIFRKRIRKSEIKWGGMAIPRTKKTLFPNPRIPFDLHDEETTYRVEIDEQFRLRFPQWLRNHPYIKADDEVMLLKENGTLKVWRSHGLLRAFRYNCNGECLHEPPGDNPPIKGKKKIKWKKVTTSKGNEV